MDYLILVLVFGGIFLIVEWGHRRDIWRSPRGCCGCSNAFDREQALKEEEEAGLRKRAAKKSKEALI